MQEQFADPKKSPLDVRLAHSWMGPAFALLVTVAATGLELRAETQPAETSPGAIKAAARTNSRLRPSVRRLDQSLWQGRRPILSVGRLPIRLNPRSRTRP